MVGSSIGAVVKHFTIVRIRKKTVPLQTTMLSILPNQICSENERSFGNVCVSYPGHSKGPSDRRRWDLTGPWRSRRRRTSRERWPPCQFGDPTQLILCSFFASRRTWCGCLSADSCTDKNDIGYCERVVICFLGMFVIHYRQNAVAHDNDNDDP